MLSILIVQLFVLMCPIAISIAQSAKFTCCCPKFSAVVLSKSLSIDSLRVFAGLSNSWHCWFSGWFPGGKLSKYLAAIDYWLLLFASISINFYHTNRNLTESTPCLNSLPLLWKADRSICSAISCEQNCRFGGFTVFDEVVIALVSLNVLPVLLWQEFGRPIHDKMFIAMVNIHLLHGELLWAYRSNLSMFVLDTFETRHKGYCNYEGKELYNIPNGSRKAFVVNTSPLEVITCSCWPLFRAVGILQIKIRPDFSEIIRLILSCFLC